MLLTVAAIDRSLTEIIDRMLIALDGIPDDVFTTWRPAAAREGSHNHEMNTFAALATHTIGSAEYWTLMAAGARPMTRVREEEFLADATLADLRDRYGTFLTDVHELLGTLTEADLAAEAAPEVGHPAERWSLAECLLHAIDHAALHLGHVQIQRQLWEYERESGGSAEGSR